MAKFNKPNISARLQKKVENRLTEFNKRFIINLSEAVIVLSPTGKPYEPFWHPDSLPPSPGYEPGLFASNWQAGIGSQPSGIEPNVGADSAKEYSLNNIKDILQDYKAGQRVFVVNNVPYAAVLEENPEVKKGPFSFQVPDDGIVGSVIANIPAIRARTEASMALRK